MSEQFDKKLVEKIRDSFDGYEEPYDPAQWDRLSSVYFKRQRRIVPLWLYVAGGIAASLVVALLLWPTIKQAELGDSPLVADVPERVELNEAPQAQSPGVDSQNFESGLPDVETDKPDGKDISPRVKVPSEKVSQKPGADLRRDLTATDVSSVETPTLADLLPNSLNLQVVPQEVIIEQKSNSLANQDIRTKEMEEAKELINTWLAQEDSGLPQEDPAPGLPLKLGLLVSPQANSNAVSGMNLGAGVMSEFSLSKRLKLDVGMTYARHTLTPDQAPSMVLAAEAAPVARDQMALASDIRGSANFMGSSSQLNLASLDIPVNLKYQVVENQKSGILLIAGLSSMVYLDQSATETFQTNSFFTTTANGVAFAPSVEQFTSVFTPEGTNGADIGRMLNLSFGYEHNLSNGLYISFEPFYKLPLGSMTFVNQQFSVAGMNIRMNFNLKK